MAEDLESITDKLTVREDDVLAVVHPRIAQVVHDGITLVTSDKPMISGPEVKARPYEGRYMFSDSPQEESLIPVSTNQDGRPTKEYPNTLASEMVYGFFGGMGYVDLIQQRGSPRLIGIVHVPRKLVYLIGALEGDNGLEEFYKQFCMETEGDRWKNHRWNLQSHPTEVDKEVLRMLPIEGEQYYWKIEKPESDMFKDGRPIPEQIAEYVATVRDFIRRLDNHVYSIRPGGSLEDTITPDMAKVRFEAIQRGDVKYLPAGDFSTG